MKLTFKTLIITFAVASLAAISMAGFFDRYSFICQLCSHLRLIWAALSISLALLFYCLRTRKTAALCLVLCAINAAQALSLYFPRSNPQNIAQTQQLTLLEMNLWGGRNRDYGRAITVIRDNNADLVGLSEVTQGWLQTLKSSLTEYPYSVADPRFGGVAVFSKYPLTDVQVLHFGKIHRPRIECKIDVNGQNVALIFVHTVTPVKRAGLKFRNRELREIAKDAHSFTAPVIVAGDINCSPWSSYFGDFLQDASLRDTEQGFGIQPSWNAWSPIAFIPIDHCFTSEKIVTLDRRVGQRFGSDHLPVFIKMSLPKRAT